MFVMQNQQVKADAKANSRMKETFLCLFKNEGSLVRESRVNLNTGQLISMIRTKSFNKTFDTKMAGMELF